MNKREGRRLQDTCSVFCIPKDIIYSSEFLPSFSCQVWVYTFLDLFLVDKIIIFIAKLYANRHIFEGPIFILLHLYLVHMRNLCVNK